MKTKKLYFRSNDDTICTSLDSHLADALDEGLKEITLIEALPDLGNPDIVFCGHHGECAERSECKKSSCNHYSSKSGRGVCINRGQLYLHGDPVTFNVY